MMIRITANFHGRVQGVGFRYTTIEIAKRFAVAGYVQNLPNGDVKAVAEGAKAEVIAFFDTVKERMSRNIINMDQTETAATQEFGSPESPDTFTIRY